MKTKVHKNSIDAYRSLKLGPRQKLVLDALKYGPKTYKQLRAYLRESHGGDWEINCITGRIGELREMGLVVVVSHIICSKTRKRNMVFGLANRQDSFVVSNMNKTWERSKQSQVKKVSQDPPKPKVCPPKFSELKDCPECKGGGKKRRGWGKRRCRCENCGGLGTVLPTGESYV